MQVQAKPKHLWFYALHKLFDYPSIVLIGGIWKSGKTDFGLRIAEDLLKLPSQHSDGQFVIAEMASNIDTKEFCPQVYDLVSLRRWLYSNKKRKLYIFDEASEHLQSRQAMTSKNVGFLKMIPEISKAHARMIIIGHQLLTIDKQLLDEVWCRGIFQKIGLKKAQLLSHLLPQEFVFTNIPRTTIPFDPYDIAPFQELPTANVVFKNDTDRQLLWEWSHGKKWHELGIQKMTLHRKVLAFVKAALENESNK